MFKATYTDQNVPLIYKDAALRNLTASRPKLIRAAEQFDKAGETEAAHGVRLALLMLEDAKDSTK